MSLAEAKVKADRIYQRNAEYGIPKLSSRRVPKDICLSDAFAKYMAQKSYWKDEVERRICAKWQATTNSLITQHLIKIPQFTFFRDISRARLKGRIDKLSLSRPTRAKNLIKVLKPFFRWAVEQGLMQGNPLAAFRLEIPEESRRNISMEDIASAYDNAHKLGEPWSTIVRLAILTGEPIDIVRCMSAEAIDWAAKRFLIKDYRTDQTRFVNFSAMALGILVNQQHKSGYLFPSPYAPRNSGFLAGSGQKPVYWRYGITEALLHHCDFVEPWTMREILREVGRYIDTQAGGRENAHEQWAEELSAAIAELRQPTKPIEPPDKEEVAL